VTKVAYQQLSMAANQKSVFIRFNMDDKADEELHLKLSEKADSSVSLTSYVREHWKNISMLKAGWQSVSSSMRRCF
jgi:hypothetical protein